jgi:uncharacterized protein YjbI with pentapeptide repeats
VRPDFSGTNLNGFCFSAYDLSGSNFERAVLHRADFRDSVLADANLRHAELIDAEVGGADLRRADFSESDVEGIRYDKRMRCSGTRVGTCFGSPRFTAAVHESDYIEAFRLDHKYLAQLWKITSDYGRSPLRTAIWGGAIVLAFSVVYFAAPDVVHWQSSARSWFDPIYMSTATFATLGYSGSQYPVGIAGQMLSGVEVLTGYLWLGYLVSIFTHRASTRY